MASDSNRNARSTIAGPPSATDGGLEAREVRKRRREWIAIVALVFLFLGLTVLEFRLSSVSNSLPFVNSIFFFGLLNLNIILLIALVWLVFRNIGKLFLERRSRILGARLKTKLVIAFFSFSIIPTLTLFVISALYINSSFDKWFSIKVQNTLEASLEITRGFYRNAEGNAQHFAEHLARGIASRWKAPAAVTRPESAWDPVPSDRPASAPGWVSAFLETQRELLALDCIEFYHHPFDERVVAHRPNPKELPAGYPRLSMDILNRAFGGEKISVIQHVGAGDLIRIVMPVSKAGQGQLGVLAVNTFIPISLQNKVGEIARVVDDYRDINPLQYPVKTAYLVILVMITLVILFVAIWMGLYLARQLTDPVERLVHGAQAVGAGDLDIRIQASGEDEISVLIDSFNRMTGDLRENRERLTQASRDLEKRRLQLEAVLAKVATGVVVVERTGEVRTFNPAVAHLLELRPESVLGMSFSASLAGGELAPLVSLIDKAIRLAEGEPEPVEPFSLQWNFRAGDRVKMLLAVVSPVFEALPAAGPSDADAAGPQRQLWGVVVAIDDLTPVVKGQRETAWREVARRIAHEIKNPLTPIKLSAQRIQRRFVDHGGRDAELVRECAETIITHTDALKEMVNEFSSFARFPEVSPAPDRLPEAVREVLNLYSPAHPSIRFRLEVESEVPVFEFDREQIKRVLINLLENAVAAFGTAGRPESSPGATVEIGIRHNPELELATMSVRDNGPGMGEDVLSRVFEPYFSTKSEGTGLGLAIAKRIVNDHDGFIRVHSSPGEGTTFTVELPTSSRVIPGRDRTDVAIHTDY